MAHYTVQSSSRQNQKMFRICGYSLMVLMLLFLGLSQTDWLDDRWSHMLGWTAMGLLGLALIGVYVLIFKESMNKYWQKVSFDVVENKFVRVVDGQAPIEFPLNKISFISESRRGLVVRSDEPSKAFVIPRAVEGFEQLRLQLSEHHEVTPSKNKTLLVLILPLVLIIAMYALLFTAKNASMLAFLEQHSLALVILMTVTATFSWWITRKKLAVRDGLDVRFVGRVLIIAATAMALLTHAPLALTVVVFLLGLALSIVGGMKFRTARQSRP